MELRQAFDYFRPSALIAVIADMTDDDIAGPTERLIVQDAWDALIVNVSLEDAIEMAMNAGIDYTDLEAPQS